MCGAVIHFCQTIKIQCKKDPINNILGSLSIRNYWQGLSLSIANYWLGRSLSMRNYWQGRSLSITSIKRLRTFSTFDPFVSEFLYLRCFNYDINYKKPICSTYWKMSSTLVPFWLFPFCLPPVLLPLHGCSSNCLILDFDKVRSTVWLSMAGGGFFGHTFQILSRTFKWVQVQFWNFLTFPKISKVKILAKFEFRFFTPTPLEGGTKKWKFLELLIEPRLLNIIFRANKKRTKSKRWPTYPKNLASYGPPRI